MESFAKISFMADDMVVMFSSGKKKLYPLDDFPELLGSSNEVRRQFEFINEGKTVRWESLDFELPLERLLPQNEKSTV